MKMQKNQLKNVELKRWVRESIGGKSIIIDKNTTILFYHYFALIAPPIVLS